MESRALLAALACVGMSVLLAGCGDSPTPAPTPAPRPTPRPTPAGPTPKPTPRPTPRPTPPGPSPSDTCSHQSDHDCTGGDLMSMASTSVGDCCDKCAADQGCKGFTYSAAQKLCYMKSGCDTAVASPGNVAGKVTNPLPPPPPGPPFKPTNPAASGKAMGPFFPMRGVAYGPLPVSPNSPKKGCEEDMVQSAYAMQWGPTGRDDLGMIQTLGANSVRLYHSLGNIPANTKEHGPFLDRAFELGLHVLPGYHTYMECPNSDCFDSWKKATLDGFKLGLKKNGAWHPGVSALILLNEPDYFPCPDVKKGEPNYCRVTRGLSAMEGVLAAEKEMGFSSNSATLPMMTITWSFAEATSIDKKVTGPGIFGFQDMVAGVANPALAHYTPRDHDGLKAAFETRWIHGLNTQAPWDFVKGTINKAYQEFLPKRWFIGEYGANGQTQTVIENDMKAMDTFAKTDPGFAGVNFFQFQTAYAKGGAEMNFGLFSLGNQLVGNTDAVPDEYQVYCLESSLPWFEKAGHPEMSHRAEATAKGWGGSAVGRGTCAKTEESLVV